MASLRKDGPLDVKVFYTRASDGPASSSLLYDDAQALSSLSVSGLPLHTLMTNNIFDVLVSSERKDHSRIYCGGLGAAAERENG